MDWNNLLKPQFIWIVIGFFLIISEFAISGLVISFFGFGALVVGLLCAFLDLSVNMQLLIFLLTSVFSLLVLRKRFKNIFMGKLETNSGSNNELEEFLGQRAVVTMEIKPNALGKVEFHGTNWEAEAEQMIPEDTVVEIIGKKNITFIVKQI